MSSVVGVLVDVSIGPFAESSLDEPFGFSIGAWGVRPGSFGFDAQVLAGIPEAMGLIAAAIVGKDATDADAEPCIPGDSGVEEVGRGSLFLVWVQSGEGDAGVVVDGDVQELSADASDGVAAMAGNAMGRLLDLDQALDVEVQQITRGPVFIADYRRLWLDVPYPVELETAQDAADGSRADLQF